MSLASLQKQFQKEFKANPKKAAILGLLLLVAVYFWAPLALKLVGGGSKRASKTKTTPPAESEPSKTSEPEPQTKVAEKAPVSSGVSWDEIWKWMQADPLTKSASQLQTDHDPFHRVEKIIETTESEVPLAQQNDEVPVEAPVRDLSPGALGMQLTSTIVGSSRSVAMIDDRAYVLGHHVVAYEGNEKLRFELIDIQPKCVILKRDGQEYILKLRQTDALAVSVEEEPGL